MHRRKNRLAKTMAVTGDQVQYDTSAKKVLSDKNVMSLILKCCIDEFKCHDIEMIRDKCIEADPVVSGKPVEADDIPEDIRGRNVELTSVKEGSMQHDIVFDVKFPGTKKEKYGIINVEAQKKYDAGYPILKRANYYTGRMISSQKVTIFRNTRYGKLRRVFSIWIIMDVCNKKKNSITVYNTCEKQICGNFTGKKDNYCMQTVVMIGLGDHRKTDNQMLMILDVLFAKDIAAADKVRLLEELGLSMTEEVKKEVNVMCNLGEGIYEQGIEQGIEQGVEQGIGIGESNKETAMLSNIIASGKLSLEEISAVTGVEYDKVKRVSEQLATAG